MRYEKYNVSNTNQKGLFTCSRGIRLTKSDRIEGNIPLLTAGVGVGNGIASFVVKNPKMLIYKNDITIDMFGVCFYHDYEHYGDDNIHFLVNDNISDKSKLYITSVLEKSIQGFSYGRQFRMRTLNSLTITLPTLDELDENSPYSDEGYIPDFEYMEEYIKKLEQERIEALDNYLAVTGLNDYELTEEDKEILKAFVDEGISQSSKSESYWHRLMKEFEIGRVFEKIDTQKIKGKANDFPVEKSGDYIMPLLTAGIENQGLARFAKRTDCLSILYNCISVSANGANSGSVFYQPEEFAVLQDAYALKVRDYDISNEEIGLYLAGSLHKAVASTHNWNYKAGWNRIKEDMFSLPIQTDANNNPIIDPECKYHPDGYIPDWGFMEKYIKAIEKLVIADVVKYKDEVIDKVRDVVKR